jgi:hydrogenase nickel incorporation protein HypA/HybF
VHELTVALRICQALETELADEPDLVATEVKVQVGALSGIVPAALQFAWSHAVAESHLLDGSRLEIDWIDASGRCPRCDLIRVVTNLQSFRCPVCDAPIEEVTGGDELDILSVDVRARADSAPG